MPTARNLKLDISRSITDIAQLDHIARSSATGTNASTILQLVSVQNRKLLSRQMRLISTTILSFKLVPVTFQGCLNLARITMFVAAMPSNVELYNETQVQCY